MSWQWLIRRAGGSLLVLLAALVVNFAIPRMMPGSPIDVFSGGVKQDDDGTVLRKVELYMKCGATGVMFGRNMWLRDIEKALALTRRVHAILARCPR